MSFEKQMTSKDKYPNIFPRQLEAIVYIFSHQMENIVQECKFSSLYALYLIIQRIKSAERISMTPNLTNLQSTKTYEGLPLCSFSEIPCPVALLSSFSSRNLPARFSPSFRPLSPSTVNCFFLLAHFKL